MLSKNSESEKVTLQKKLKLLNKKKMTQQEINNRVLQIMTGWRKLYNY